MHEHRGDQHRYETLEQIQEEHDEEKLFTKKSAHIGRADVPAAGGANVDSFCATNQKTEWNGTKQVCQGDEDEELRPSHSV
jgi:hypothetical protein